MPTSWRTDSFLGVRTWILTRVSNEIPGVNVWFDDLNVTLKQHIVKQAIDYGLRVIFLGSKRAMSRSIDTGIRANLAKDIQKRDRLIFS